MIDVVPSDFITVKKKLEPAKEEALESVVRERKSSVPKLLKKTKNAILNVFCRKSSPARVKWFTGPHIYDFADLDADIIPEIESNLFGANSLSTNSLHSVESSCGSRYSLSTSHIKPTNVYGNTVMGAESRKEYSDLSLASFVTATESTLETGKSCSNSTPATFRLDDKEHGDETYSIPPDSTMSHSQINLSVIAEECIKPAASLISIAAACVKKRICTPYRIRNIGQGHLVAIAWNESFECSPLREERIQPAIRHFQTRINAAEPSTDIKGHSRSGGSNIETAEQSSEQFAPTKSRSIPRKFVQRISRFRKLAVGLMPASPLSMPFFG